MFFLLISANSALSFGDVCNDLCVCVGRLDGNTRRFCSKACKMYFESTTHEEASKQNVMRKRTLFYSYDDNGYLNKANTSLKFSKK